MAKSARRDVTTLLDALARGESDARHEIFALLYDELRDQAARMVRSNGRSPTLDATAIVHEAYVRLCGPSGAEWNDRVHFLAAAATAMRHVLVDHARERRCVKREPNGLPVALDEVVAVYEERAVDIERLDGALARMSEFNPEMARAVELRFFGGVGVDETARMLDMSRRTFERRWAAARAWLWSELA